ncbi:MAG: hypothetical protein NTX82_01770 [Candidatus Parcubacteria bacterium]|nr:hypothetical protein [Candidatus Parcubacteria bacterium]
MLPGEEKIKEYLEEKTEAIATKIEKTPMEKFFVFFLILITVASVVLGYMQFKQNLESPFYASRQKIVRADIKDKYNINQLNDNTNLLETEALKTKDSDLDGLDDYSEIYIYGTNPYLEDTDNDGVWDKQEILNGTNPNCAEGTDCATTGQEASPTVSMPTLEELLPATPTFDENSNTVNYNGTSDESLAGLQNSDFQSMINQLQNQDLTAEEKAQGLEQLKNLTPAQIREQLISSGFDPAMLEQIDDQTLQQAFLDLVSTYTQSQ